MTELTRVIKDTLPWMCFRDDSALMILVNNPGSWSHIYAPLEHAPGR